MKRPGLATRWAPLLGMVGGMLIGGLPLLMALAAREPLRCDPRVRERADAPCLPDTSPTARVAAAGGRRNGS